MPLPCVAILVPEALGGVERCSTIMRRSLEASPTSALVTSHVVWVDLRLSATCLSAWPTNWPCATQSAISTLASTPTQLWFRLPVEERPKCSHRLFVFLDGVPDDGRQMTCDNLDAGHA